jgi:hypothetical protein
VLSRLAGLGQQTMFAPGGSGHRGLMVATFNLRIAGTSLPHRRDVAGSDIDAVAMPTMVATTRLITMPMLPIRTSQGA